MNKIKIIKLFVLVSLRVIKKSVIPLQTETVNTKKNNANQILMPSLKEDKKRKRLAS